MNQDNSNKARQYFAVKIVAIVLIVCVIAGIWIVKNSQKETVSEGGGNPDFALNATDTLDLEKLKSYGLPIIIEFGADYCAPCKQMAPIIDALNEELRGKAIIKYVDVEKYSSLAYGYPISVIPTQLFYDADGKPYFPEDPNAVTMNFYKSNNSDEHIYTTHEGTLTKIQLLAILEEMGMK